MSTLEYLLIQIFERKKWIIQQMQHHTDLYDQYIASKLSIEGIPIPPWLINSVNDSEVHDSQADLQESQQPYIFHPNVSPSQFVGTSFTNTTNGFSDSFIEKKPSGYGVEAANLDTDPQMPCSSDAFDPISNIDIASPPPSDHIGICHYNKSGNFSSIIHRSRSRQKALELRNSSKKGPKYGSKEDVDKNNATDVAVLSKSPADLISSGHIIELLGLAKSSGITDGNNVETVDGRNDRWKDNSSHSYADTNSNLENSIIPSSMNKISNSGRMRQSSSEPTQPSDRDDQHNKLSSPRNLSFVVGEDSVGNAMQNAENEEPPGMCNSSIKILECSDPYTEFVPSHQHGQAERGYGSSGTINDLVEAYDMGEDNAPASSHRENNEPRSLILNVDHSILDRSFGNGRSSNSMNLNLRPDVPFIDFKDTPSIVELSVPTSASCHTLVSEKHPYPINESFGFAENTMCDGYVNDKSNSYCGRITRSRSCRQKKSDGNIGSPLKPASEIILLKRSPCITNSEGVHEERKTRSSNFIEIESRNDKNNSYCGRITRSRSCRQKKSDGNIGSPVKPASEIILSKRSPHITNSEGVHKERKTRSPNFIEIETCNVNFSDIEGADRSIKESHEKISTGECVIPDSTCNSTERRYENAEQTSEEIVLERTSSVSIDGGLGSSNSGRSPSDVQLNIAHDSETIPFAEKTSIMQTKDDVIDDTRYDISLDVLDLPNSVMERASVLERICRSASMHSPISQFPSLYKLNGLPDFGHSCSNEIIEGSYELNRDTEKQLTELYAMNSPSPDDGCSMENNTTCTSPSRKLWDGGNALFSSEKTKMRRSFNPNHTCFPIEEEGNGNIDEVVDSFQDGGVISSDPNISKGYFVTEITEQCTNPLELLTDTSRASVEYLNVETSFNPFNDEVRQNTEDDKNRKHTQMKDRDNKNRKYTYMKDGKEGRFLSVGPDSSRRKREPPCNRMSKQKLSRNTGSLKNKSTSLLEDQKHNNIIHNITSFVPFVHQKQNSTAFTGKRDIKVKALETAEAAKRLEEKKEIDRKMKKEALKLERARLDKKKKLETKKKEEELKRKDIIAATNKRKREAGVGRERKKNHIEDAKTLKKGDKKVHLHKEDRTSDEREKSEFETGMAETSEKELIMDIDLSKTRLSTSDDKKSTTMSGNFNASMDCQDGGKVAMEMSDVADTHVVAASLDEEPEYVLSPYRGSEDEEDDETANRKPIPGWASKKNLGRLMVMQQFLDPKMIFFPESFSPVI